MRIVGEPYLVLWNEPKWIMSLIETAPSRSGWFGECRARNMRLDKGLVESVLQRVFLKATVHESNG